MRLSSLSHGDPSALRVTRVSCALHVLSSCVLCLAPPAVDFLEALGWCVCTRPACCSCLRMSHFRLPLVLLSIFLGVGAPSLSLGGFML